MSNQLANTLVMFAPQDFDYNAQTAADNHFQHQPANSDTVQRQAMDEFSAMVKLLRDNQLNIIELTKNDQFDTPDAVFPNNWFTTTEAGELHLYPMKTVNRQLELRYSLLLDALRQSGRHTKRVIDWRQRLFNPTKQIVEGTGAIVFDHQQKIAFGALSERCELQLLENICQFHNYQLCAFNTLTTKGAAVYHSNVMMSIGEGFTVICTEVIEPNQRQKVVDLLTDKQIIEISEQQMLAMCGNILQVKNNQGEPLIIMSQSALQGFDAVQIKQLERFGRLLAPAIPTIESVGGGSCRCMLAEVFF